MTHRLLRFLPILTVVALGVTAPAALAVDVVVPNNQIVQGYQCVGIPCVSGELFSGPTLMSKSNDTPGLRLFQTGGGFGSQTWDVSGNEANFFVRDATAAPVTLPFRIRPGAPTSSIDVASNGEVSTVGVVQQTVGSIAFTDVIDGAAVLVALRGIDVSHYTAAGAVHAAPSGLDFRTAFGLGGANATLAPMDVSAIALAGVKALDARVAAISLTPGAKGDTGATGATGSASAAGSAGDDLSAATARIAALEKTNRRLLRLLATVQRQVTALARAGRATSTRGGAGNVASGRAGS